MTLKSEYIFRPCCEFGNILSNFALVKKLFLSILTFLYMLSSTGIAMEVHYCMGKKAGVDFFKVENQKCKKCGMTEKKGGCCKDEHKFYKLKADCKNVYQLSVLSFKSFDLIGDYYSKPQLSYSSCSKLVRNNNYSPPDKNTPAVFILNCVFRL